MSKKSRRVLLQSENPDREVVERMVHVANDVRLAIQNEKIYGSFSTSRVIDWAACPCDLTCVKRHNLPYLSKMSSIDARSVEDILDLYF